jgi:hypothetical protein
MECVDWSTNNFLEVRKLILDRDAWRCRIKMIVAANKEVDCRKREDDSKIRRIKTRCAIVVVFII